VAEARTTITSDIAGTTTRNFVMFAAAMPAANWLGLLLDMVPDAEAVDGIGFIAPIGTAAVPCIWGRAGCGHASIGAGRRRVRDHHQGEVEEAT